MTAARYPRRARLLTPPEFDAVFKNGRRHSHRAFVLIAMDSPQGNSRLGLAVPKKIAPRAVARNRIKRTVRESFRQRSWTQAVDVVFSPRPSILALAPIDLRAALAQAWLPWSAA